MTEQPESYEIDQADVERLKERTLSNLAASAADLPHMLASTLRSWARHEGLLNDERIAQSLGIDAPGLRRLRLCRTPDSSRPDFAEQVRQVAEYTGVDFIKLANLVRQEDAIRALGPRQIEGTSTEPGQAAKPVTVQRMMAAARDRDEQAASLRELSSLYAPQNAVPPTGDTDAESSDTGAPPLSDVPDEGADSPKPSQE